MSLARVAHKNEPIVGINGHRTSQATYTNFALQRKVLGRRIFAKRMQDPVRDEEAGSIFEKRGEITDGWREAPSEGRITNIDEERGRAFDYEQRESSRRGLSCGSPVDPLLYASYETKRTPARLPETLSVPSVLARVLSP